MHSIVIGIGKEDSMFTDDKLITEKAALSEAGEAKRTYTVLEIAAVLRISKSKAYELCNQGLFRIIRVGRSVRISKASFDEWLDKQMD